MTLRLTGFLRRCYSDARSYANEPGLSAKLQGGWLQSSSARPAPCRYLRHTMGIGHWGSAACLWGFLGVYWPVWGEGLTMSSSQPKGRVISLVRPLRNITVTAGETATFQCELSYEDIPVDWYLGDTKLESSDRVSPVTPDTPVCPLPSQPRCWLWSRIRPLSFPSASCAVTACSYKVLQVEVQDSSWAFDPGFEITQAGGVFCPASASVGLFLTAARGRSTGQVGTADIC